MVRYPAPIPPELPWPVFTRAEARRAGVSPDRLRRPDLTRLRRGLYALTSVTYGEADLVAAMCRNDPDIVVVGLSAARLLGIPLPQRRQQWDRHEPVHLATRGSRGSSDRLMTWHDFVLSRTDARRFEYRIPANGATCSITVSSRARTWRDLAAYLTHEQLVAAGDHLVRRPRPWAEGRDRPWCTRADLNAACSGRHARLLRRAWADIRVGSDSPMETQLRLAFIAAGLPEPQINTALIGDDGVERHSPDFQWPEYELCVEYEGEGHNDEEQVRRDIRRARAVKAAGWGEVRLFNEDTWRNCAGAIQQVREALLERGWRPGQRSHGPRSSSSGRSQA